MANNERKVNKNILSAILMSVIPLSAMTMPLVLNQPVQASCAPNTSCNDSEGSYGYCETSPCVDTPLIANQSGDRIIFRWTGKGDVYHIRYQVGGGEQEGTNHSGSFTVTNVRPNRVYSIKVQACDSHFLRRSTCTSWHSKSFTTR
jgi:hypothetical protein